ncbi:MAG TPA: hypothetical protein VGH64_08735 [Puia sp.]
MITLITSNNSYEPDFHDHWQHVAIAYKNKQMKIYLDQNRLYVIPEVKDDSINKLAIRVAGKCVVTNIRIDAGSGMNMIGIHQREANNRRLEFVKI